MPYLSQGGQRDNFSMGAVSGTRARAGFAAAVGLLAGLAGAVRPQHLAQVAGLICAARDVRAIAKELQVSAVTVRLHLRALHRRLGVNSRLALLRAVPSVPAPTSLVPAAGAAVAESIRTR
jgi:hypothetical protein